MGHSNSWVAVESLSIEEVCDRFDLTPTLNEPEKPENFLDEISKPTARKQSGWTADVEIVESGEDWLVVNAPTHGGFVPGLSLNELSQNCRLVATQIDDQMNRTRIEEWRYGERIWSILHDIHASQGDELMTHLEAVGILPTIFEEVRARYQKRHADDEKADRFSEIPIEIGELITGFRHDATSGMYSIHGVIPVKGSPTEKALGTIPRPNCFLMLIIVVGVFGLIIWGLNRLYALISE